MKQSKRIKVLTLVTAIADGLCTIVEGKLESRTYVTLKNTATGATWVCYIL